MRAPPAGVLLSLLVSAGLLSCDSATAPEPEPPSGTVTVSLFARMDASHVWTSAEAKVYQRCLVTYRATAAAQGGGRAVWQDATFLWFAGPDRSAPVDSLRISSSDMRASWGADTVAIGSSAQSTWELMADIPFEIRFQARYRVIGEREPRVATVDHPCGPTLPPGEMAAPSLSGVSLQADGELEPGDTFAVTYTATSPGALWKTVLHLDGPFQAVHEIAEHPARESTRTVRLPVPAGAALGTPVRVRVEAVDIAAQTAADTLHTAPLVDRTPPSVLWLSMHEVWSGVLSGSYATTDTISFTAMVGDNAQLDYLVYELSAPVSVRDSVKLSGVLAQGIRVRIPVQPEWVGAPTLRVYARDAAGLIGGEHASLPDSIRIYPVVNRTVRSADFSAPRHEDAVLDARRGRVYVSVPANRRIEVLSLETMTFESPIVFSTTPGGLDLSVSGDSLLVALPEERALAVVDLHQVGAAPARIPLTAVEGASPKGVEVMADHQVMVSFHHMERSGLYLVDLPSGSHQVVFRAGASAEQRVARTHDRSRAIVADHSSGCVRLYVAATDHVGECRAPVSWSSISADAAGRRYAIGLDLLDETMARTRTLRTFELGATHTTGMSLDGDYVYVSTHKGLVRVRAWDGTGEERIPMPPVNGRILMSPDGSYLVAVNEVVGEYGRMQILTVDLR